MSNSVPEALTSVDQARVLFDLRPEALNLPALTKKISTTFRPSNQPRHQHLGKQHNKDGPQNLPHPLRQPQAIHRLHQIHILRAQHRVKALLHPTSPLRKDDLRLLYPKCHRSKAKAKVAEPGKTREMLAAALPPLPSPNQLSALHNRQNPPAPRPVSGSFQIPRVPIGRDLQDRPPSSSRFSLQANFSSPPAPELPLIISTPTGVTGAFDTPDQAGTQTTPAEPVLHAPVPRHPRPILGVGGPNSPVAERLEGVYSTTGQQGPNGQPLMVPPPPSSSQLTSSSLRHHTSLSRRPSRARRSAAKNVQDAKTRGWAGRRRRKNAEKEPDGASSAAWTDVTWASNAPRDGKATKASKCMVM
ncbi:hypothetical protein PG989_009366 [Apiospora arundinis]